MSEADQIVAAARAREEARSRHTQPIDYARMQREFPKQKARLTRAFKKWQATGDRSAVVLACRDVVKEWDEIGAWPDDWSHWQRTLDDVFPYPEFAPQLEDLR